MAADNILETVPKILREPLDNYETVIPSLLPPFLAAASCDLNDALLYVMGASTHQARVNDEASKVFKGVILRVKVIERGTLGKKATIIFEADGNKGREEQEINTGWIEYNGNQHLEHDATPFDISLSKTMIQMAEENKGKEVFIRKAFAPAVTSSGGDKVRYIADLSIPFGSAKKDDDRDASRSSTRSESRSDTRSRGSSRRRDEDAEETVDFTPDSLADIIDDEGIDVDLKKSERADLADALTKLQGKRGKLVDEIADIFSLDEDGADDLDAALKGQSGTDLAVAALKTLGKLL